MPATQQIPANVDDLRAAHRSRLRVLERQAASMGNDTPPHIVTEIDQIRAKLVELSDTVQQVAQAPIDPELADALGPVGRYQLLYSHIMRLDADIGRVRRDMERLDTKLDDLIGEVLRALGKRPRRRKPQEVTK